MKKNNLLLVTLFSIGITTANAQIGLVHTFSDTLPSAQYPTGAVTLSGATLYGTARGGGLNNKGCVYSVDTNGANYKDIFDFNGTNGSAPMGTLVLSGSTLYGITSSGGAHDSGCIFSIGTNGSGYADLHDFAGPDGNHGPYSYSGLVLSGGVLYGMTEMGGTHHGGVVFSINTNGTGFADLLNLDAATGSMPMGPPVVENGRVFGETIFGGTNGLGTVFSVKTDGSGFKVLYDFSSNTIYGNDGFLTPLKDKLYGMVNQNGVGAYGGIFSVDTAGGGFKDVYEFSGTFGDDEGGLTLYGNLFFGASFDGGNYTDGLIFSIDTNGTGYNTLYTFNGVYGNGINGSLVASANKLFGTAQSGGSTNVGTVYRFNTLLPTGVSNVAAVSGTVNVYPNPNNGNFTLSCHSEGNEESNSIVEVYNVLGEIVYSQTLRSAQGDNAMDLSTQPNGIYLYRVLSQDGDLIGEGKIEIQK